MKKTKFEIQYAQMKGRASVCLELEHRTRKINEMLAICSGNSFSIEPACGFEIRQNGGPQELYYNKLPIRILPLLDKMRCMTLLPRVASQLEKQACMYLTVVTSIMHEAEAVIDKTREQEKA
jgi:hypothetical protein